MMIDIRRIKKITLHFSIITLSFFSSVKSTAISAGDRDQEIFSINLKSRVVVIGPLITLGDIGYVVIKDSVKKSLLNAVKITEAPPPGESTEISINFIKRCLKVAGFRDYIPFLKGPKVIRVTTAQVEIDKAFLREEYALGNENSFAI